MATYGDATWIDDRLQYVNQRADFNVYAVNCKGLKSGEYGKRVKLVTFSSKKEKLIMFA